MTQSDPIAYSRRALQAGFLDDWALGMTPAAQRVALIALDQFWSRMSDEARRKFAARLGISYESREDVQEPPSDEMILAVIIDAIRIFDEQVQIERHRIPRDN